MLTVQDLLNEREPECVVTCRCERKEVHPSYLGGTQWWVSLFNRKRYVVGCGVCLRPYVDRVSYKTDVANSVCPYCGALNTWAHSYFKELYSNG